MFTIQGGGFISSSFSWVWGMGVGGTVLGLWTENCFLALWVSEQLQLLKGSGFIHLGSLNAKLTAISKNLVPFNSLALQQH